MIIIFKKSILNTAVLILEQQNDTILNDIFIKANPVIKISIDGVPFCCSIFRTILILRIEVSINLTLHFIIIKNKYCHFPITFPFFFKLDKL